MSHLIFRNLRNPLVKSVVNLKIQNERSLSFLVPSTCAFSVSQKRHYNFIFSPSKWFCMHEQRRWSNLERPPWERLTIKSVEEKVVSTCKAYDKINADKLTLDTHFVNDLGLDSLDHVEVIMAMEDEFGFEIPDRDAERLLTPRAIVQYVCDREDVYE